MPSFRQASSVVAAADAATTFRLLHSYADTPFCQQKHHFCQLRCLPYWQRGERVQEISLSVGELLFILRKWIILSLHNYNIHKCHILLLLALYTKSQPAHSPHLSVVYSCNILVSIILQSKL